MLKIAFAGFRHGHIMGLYDAAQDHPRLRLVASCEEDATAAQAIASAGRVNLTHTSFAQMLQSVDCDAIAVGDYFAKRGSLIIQSLQAGKHVISDKPICTTLDELDQIEQFAREKNLRVGCLLDLRDCGAFITTRRLIYDGAIGQVLTVAVSAQHPLNLETRPAWYFEPGKQGGTINDIAIHAIDLIPWMTGRRIVACLAARTWNARVPQFPHFHDGGQFICRLDNDGGILGDVSYFSPDFVAYSAPQYWRITIHGTDGIIETAYASRSVWLASGKDGEPRHVEPDADVPLGVLDAFLNDIEGKSEAGSLTTRDVLDASRRTLLIQQAADQRTCDVRLE